MKQIWVGHLLSVRSYIRGAGLNEDVWLADQQLLQNQGLGRGSTIGIKVKNKG